MRKVVFCLVGLFVVALDAIAATPLVRVAKYRGDKQCAISYTFDDGLMDQYTLAAPQLEQLGWRGTFAINGRKIDIAMAKNDTTRFAWSHVVDLDRRGHEISNHGWEHRKMTRLSKEQIQREISLNDSAIIHHIQKHPLSFCYPYNAKDSLICQMAEQGRVVSRMYQIAIGRASSLQKMNRWVDRTIEEGGWGVGMAHGILSGYDAFTSYADFESHLQYTHSKEESIWVAPLAEVAAYIAEQKSVSISVEMKRNQLVIRPHLELDQQLYSVPLTIVVEGVERVKEARQGRHKLSVTTRGGAFLFDMDPYGGSVKIKY